MKKPNKYLIAERKAQMSFSFTEKPKRAKKVNPRSIPLDFSGQTRMCEVCGCCKTATKTITGPNNETHHYCDECWPMESK